MTARQPCGRLLPPGAHACACARCELARTQAAAVADWRGEHLIRGRRAAIEVRNMAQGWISNLVRRPERQRGERPA